MKYKYFQCFPLLFQGHEVKMKEKEYFSGVCWKTNNNIWVLGAVV